MNPDRASIQFDLELPFEEEQPDEYGSELLVDRLRQVIRLVSDYTHCWDRRASLELSLRIHRYISTMRFIDQITLLPDLIKIPKR